MDGHQQLQVVAIKVSGGSFSEPFYSFRVDGQSVDLFNENYLQAGFIHHSGWDILESSFCHGVDRNVIPSWVTGGALSDRGNIRVKSPMIIKEASHYCTAHASMTASTQVKVAEGTGGTGGTGGDRLQPMDPDAVVVYTDAVSGAANDIVTFLLVKNLRPFLVGSGTKDTLWSW